MFLGHHIRMVLALRMIVVALIAGIQHARLVFAQSEVLWHLAGRHIGNFTGRSFITRRRMFLFVLSRTRVIGEIDVRDSFLFEADPNLAPFVGTGHSRGISFFLVASFLLLLWKYLLLGQFIAFRKTLLVQLQPILRRYFLSEQILFVLKNSGQQLYMPNIYLLEECFF